MKIGSKQNLLINQLSYEEFLPIFRKHRSTVFADDHSYELSDILSEKQKEIQKSQREKIVHSRLCLGIYNGNILVGWCHSYVAEPLVLNLCNAGFLREHFRFIAKNRDLIFNTLISKNINFAKENHLSVIYSLHNTTNNTFIIPLLKRGFTIAGMELSDTYGTLVKLKYFINPKRRKIINYRSGLKAPDGEVKKLFTKNN